MIVLAFAVLLALEMNLYVLAHRREQLQKHFEDAHGWWVYVMNNDSKQGDRHGRGRYERWDGPYEDPGACEMFLVDAQQQYPHRRFACVGIR